MPESSPASTPSANAAFLLSGLGRVVRDEIETELHRVDLSLRHLSALGHLSREPGISYSELARRAGVTAQSMQATLRQLEDRGAVERTTPAGRGRTARLRVTDAGRHLLSRGHAAIARIDDRLFDGVDPAERQHLVRLLLEAFAAATRNRSPRAGPTWLPPREELDRLS